MITLIIIVVLESILLAWMIKKKKTLKELASTWRADYFALKQSYDKELNK